MIVLVYQLSVVNRVLKYHFLPKLLSDANRTPRMFSQESPKLVSEEEWTDCHSGGGGCQLVRSETCAFPATDPDAYPVYHEAFLEEVLAEHSVAS